MSFTVAQIQQQTQRFQQAYDSGQITKAQYDQAMAVQNANMQRARASGGGYWGAPDTAQNLSSRSALGSQDKTNAVVIKAGAGEKVVLGSIKENTSNNTVEYLVEPDNSALDLAKKQSEIQSNFGLRSNTRQGTSQMPTLTNIQAKETQITSGLTTQQKQEYIAWKEAKPTKAMTNLGLFLGSSAVAPVLGPVGAVEAVGISLGISQGFKTGETYLAGGNIKNSLLTPEEALMAAESGVILAGVGKGVYAGISQVSKIVGVGLPTGMKGVAASIMGRASVNAGLGAGASAVTSGGNPEAIERGAAFGAIFSLGMDAAMFGSRYIPTLKFGNVNVPLENGESVNWKGLYVSRQENVYGSLGKMGKVPEDVLIQSHGISGEDEGFIPRSGIESKVTLEVMRKANYNQEVIQDVKDIRSLLGETKNTKSKFIEDILPLKTGTLSEKGVGKVKDFVLENNSQVEELYGSFTSKSQVSKQFEYTKNGVSALREPGDIDIQLSVGEKEATAFANKLVGDLKSVGEDVRISQQSPRLIEANVGNGKYAHAVDIHFAGEQGDVLTPSRVDDMRWGFKLSQPSIKIEKIPVMRLSEQGIRKGTSVLGFNEDATLGPVAHRVKDIPDFFQIQRTLLSSKGVKLEDTGFNRLVERFGVADKLNEPFVMKEQFTFKPSSNIKQSVGIFAVPSQTNFSKKVSSVKISIPKVSSASVNVNFSPKLSKQSFSPSKQLAQINKSVSAFLPSNNRKTSSTPILSNVKISNPYSPTPYKPKPSSPTYPIYPKQYPSIPPYSPPKNIPKFLPSNFGGGFGESKKGSAFGTQRFQKTHKEKTYSQMLQTFGYGKAAKPMRSIEKATNRLVKSFNHKQPNKSRRKRKR